MGQRLDLPLGELAKPGYYSSALYKRDTSGNLRFSGYTAPALRTFSAHVASIMDLERKTGAQVVRSWRWYNGDWFPV